MYKKMPATQELKRIHIRIDSVKGKLTSGKRNAELQI